MGLYPSSDVLLRNPITRARAGCCARAANGHAAALPSNEMNSRRLMGTLVRLRAAHYHAVAEERRCASKQKLRANVADGSNLVSRGWCSLTSSRPQRGMPKSLFWRQADAIGGDPTQTIISAVYHARIAPATHLHAAMQTSGRRMSMKLPRRRLLYLSLIAVPTGFAIALAAPTASDAAEIKVLTTRAMNHVLTELAGAFQRTSEHKVTPILAPPAEIKKRIVNGEIVDAVMSGSGIIEDLVQQGKIARDSALILARVGYGVAVRAGSAKPDITSVEAFKRALLAARSIVYTDPAVGVASGIHFEKVLDRLGIAREIKAKSILNARAATTPSAEIVARGEAELGIQLISEIVFVPGAELLGPFPAELQAMNVISAGIVENAVESDAGRALF